MKRLLCFSSFLMKQMGFFKKMHVKSGMMTLSGGKGSCGWFENVASVCSSWNFWYVCCYDNGFLLVVMLKFDLYVQKEGSCSSFFVTVPNLIKLEVFHLNLRDWIYSRRQLPPWLTLGLWRKSGLGSGPLTATLTPFPPLWNARNNSSYFLGSHEEDSGGGLCKIFSTVSGKQSSVNPSAVVIFIIPKFLNWNSLVEGILVKAYTVTFLPPSLPTIGRKKS